ncbi:hypothetical protein EDE15_3749 [Edaphobacter aggregans]|uniref:Uncharacterized protein n=1 Tax=Edaphobacter aggregans TaxID=570835 RepID=A0A3R9QCU2_9BACT|nr:hypothetical protein EDE15_3749 [Edaphobacter aggregans]
MEDESALAADEFDGAPPPRSVRRVLLGLQHKLRGLGSLTDMSISQSCLIHQAALQQLNVVVRHRWPISFENHINIAPGCMPELLPLPRHRPSPNGSIHDRVGRVVDVPFSSPKLVQMGKSMNPRMKTPKDSVTPLCIQQTKMTACVFCSDAKFSRAFRKI